jgi:carbamoyltransferase
LLRTLHSRHGLDSVTLAGGCAMNSVANGKVRRETPYKRVYIQSAAGDAGGAIGAATQIWRMVADERQGHRGYAPSALEGDTGLRRPVMDHAYLGSSFSDAEISSLIEQRAQEITNEGCQFLRISEESELCKETAEAVSRGQVVGWFQGRMEWGPRALGNRSIICDPRRSDMKGILNSKIKRRESFRPFAPSILKEYVTDWFEEDGDVPFMMQVYQIREEKRSAIPAVTHVDGSGRLQTVYRQTNPLYWRLIDEFRRLTGVPMVLNTSFNENEPVVCRPEEALNCFLRTKMDLLVLGNWIFSRQQS